MQVLLQLLGASSKSENTSALEIGDSLGETSNFSLDTEGIEAPILDDNANVQDVLSVNFVEDEVLVKINLAESETFEESEIDPTAATPINDKVPKQNEDRAFSGAIAVKALPSRSPENTLTDEQAPQQPRAQISVPEFALMAAKFQSRGDVRTVETDTNPATANKVQAPFQTRSAAILFDASSIDSATPPPPRSNETNPISAGIIVEKAAVKPSRQTSNYAKSPDVTEPVLQKANIPQPDVSKNVPTSNVEKTGFRQPGPKLVNSASFVPAPNQTEAGKNTKREESDNRPVHLEKPTQKGDISPSLRVASLETPAPKPATIEIRYNPNGLTKIASDPKEAELIDRKDSVVRIEPSVQRPAVVDALPTQKVDVRRPQPKASIVTDRRALTERDTQQQTPVQTKQPYQVPQHSILQVPLVSPTPSNPLDVTHVSDGTLSRDTDIRISGDSPEIRKEVAILQRAETPARQVVQQLTQATKTMSDGSVEIRLAPEELGRVRLSLNPGESGIVVHISAERQETMDLIRRNIELFSQSLKQEGFSNLAFSFEGSGGDQAHSGDDKEPDAILNEGAQSADNASIPQSRPRTQAMGQLDIRI